MEDKWRTPWVTRAGNHHSAYLQGKELHSEGSLASNGDCCLSAEHVEMITSGDRG